jgi:hypothetical protein
MDNVVQTWKRNFLYSWNCLKMISSILNTMSFCYIWYLVWTASVRCHETKCPLLRAFFSFALFCYITFLPVTFLFWVICGKSRLIFCVAFEFEIGGQKLVLSLKFLDFGQVLWLVGTDQILCLGFQLTWCRLGAKWRVKHAQKFSFVSQGQRGITIYKTLPTVAWLFDWALSGFGKLNFGHSWCKYTIKGRHLNNQIQVQKGFNFGPNIDYQENVQ